MKIIAVSDIHGHWEKLKIEACDILISAGDYSSGRGSEEKTRGFHLWLNKQPAKHIISVQGNHEMWPEENFGLAKQVALESCPRVHFIDEGLIEIEGLKIWCSAYTPWFLDWAWNVTRGEEIKKHWDRIPLDSDIVVTHGPMFGVLDTINGGPHLGCEELAKAIARIKPSVHIAGHIHDSYGRYRMGDLTDKITLCINASNCNEKYQCVNPPQEIYL